MHKIERQVTDPICPSISLPTVTRFEVVRFEAIGVYVEGRCPDCGAQTSANGSDGVGVCAQHGFVNLPEVKS